MKTAVFGRLEGIFLTYRIDFVMLTLSYTNDRGGKQYGVSC